MKLKKNFKSILMVTMMFFFIFQTSSIVNISLAADTTTGEQAIQGLQNLSNQQTGLVGCDPYSSYDSSNCSPKQAFSMIGRLVQVGIYIVIISIVLMIIISGVGLVYSSNRPAFLIKWKKRLMRSIMALIILIAGVGLVLGVLAAAGLKSEVLDVLKGLFASSTLSIFPHALAAATSTDISQVASQVASQAGDKYIDFFPGESLGSLVLLIFKFLINYIVAPALVVATVWAGFSFVKAEGNPEKLAKAKKFAVYVALGIASAAIAHSVISVMLNTIQDVQQKTLGYSRNPSSLAINQNRDMDTYTYLRNFSKNIV